ncbi:unnamed protein product [Mytilus coruscus]|uniref:Nuclear cap-binding protein subunit 3 n=1 Tax=Mytilus coruscus TaxID=42192 RepID=A0A6J8CTD2_MYTCO|nr:unnamed protein product [Mytilus coruscus]
MANRDEQLPNLKICIDNTESDKEQEDVVSIQGADELQSSPIESEEDNERNVEFNVRIGKIGQTRSENRTHRQVYNFAFETFGFRAEYIRRDHRGIRLEAVHFRGVNDLHTKDIFKYFGEFGPGGVEWIDDASCNVIWMDALTAARALLKQTKSYDEVMKPYEADESDDIEDQVKDEDDDNQKIKDHENQKNKENEKRKNNDNKNQKNNDDDDILDLLDDTDTIKLTGQVNGDTSDKTKEEQSDDKKKDEIPKPPAKSSKQKSQYREEIKEAREAVRAKRDAITYDDVDIFGDDLKLDTAETDFGISVTDQKTMEERLGNIKPLQDMEEGELGASSEEDVDDNDYHDSMRSDKRLFEDKPVDQEAIEMEKELEVLLKSPPKKRLAMKMYADELEEEIQAKNVFDLKYVYIPGGLTIVADNRSQEDARSLIIGKAPSTGLDLRSKLKRHRTPSWDI